MKCPLCGRELRTLGGYVVHLKAHGLRIPRHPKKPIEYYIERELARILSSPSIIVPIKR